MKTSQRQKRFGFGAYFFNGFLLFALPVTIWNIIDPIAGNRRLALICAIPTLLLGPILYAADQLEAAKLARKVRQDEAERRGAGDEQTPES